MTLGADEVLQKMTEYAEVAVADASAAYTVTNKFS